MARTKCLLCEHDARDIWVAGNYGRPGHYCVMCAECCEWDDYWQRCVQRGTADAMLRQLLVTRGRVGRVPPGSQLRRR